MAAFNSMKQQRTAKTNDCKKRPAPEEPWLQGEITPRDGFAIGRTIQEAKP